MMNLQESCVTTTSLSSILSNGISSQRGVHGVEDTLRSDLADDEGHTTTTAMNTSLLPAILVAPASGHVASLGRISDSISPSLSPVLPSMAKNTAASITNTSTESRVPSGLVNSESSELSHGIAPSTNASLHGPTKFHTPPPDPNNEMSVVTPFLVKHISDQTMIPKDNFHKYCYRHNPEVTCNKNTDEVKMKKIQKQLERLPNRDQEAISHVWSIFSAAPNQHRSLILQGLLLQCCFPQLSFVAQEVSQLIRIDFISTLPMEISLKILCYLDCKSLCNAAQVSRKWKSLADDDRVWHHMCEQHIDRKCPNCGWGLPLMHMKRAREFQSDDDHEHKRKKTSEAERASLSLSSSEQQNGRATASTQSAPRDAVAPPKTQHLLKKRPWKSVYSERFKLEKNWRKGSHTLKTFVGHTDGVTCLQFNRKYLMTGSYDSTIKIWRVDTGECIKTLTGHTKGVRSLVFDTQKLITAGLDSTIKVWNYHTGQCISTYRGHDDAVVSVDFCNKTIVSGSADHTVKVWHVDSRTCYTLRGHTDWVNSVKIHPSSNTVFSASDDTTIRMWDLENNQCLRVFGGIENNGHIGQVQCVIPLIYKDKMDFDQNGDSDNDVVEESNSNPSTRSGGVTTTHDGDAAPTTEVINDTQLPDNPHYPTHLLSSSLDNTIKLWEVKSGKCIRTQFGHIEGVWSISSDTFRIISGAHDRLIKVWDLQSGKCLHTFGNSSSVTSVGLSDSRFCAGLENGKVKMYCFD
jgi:F-box/WD-40 domain protein MET30